MAWTKAKTAIVVGITAILTVGTMTIIITKTIHPKFDPANNDLVWFVNSETMKKLPPIFIFRPTHWPQHSGPAQNVIVTDDDLDGTIVARDRMLTFYLEWAYNFPSTNIIIPQGFPAQKEYDVMLTLTNQPREVLQREIKKQFGIETRWEVRKGARTLVVEKTP